MSGVTGAIIGAGVLAAGATVYASSQASNAAAQANAQNAANVNNTNNANLQQFEQSRGSTGSAILPIYASGAEGQLFNDTLGTYDATGAIQPNAQQLQQIVQGAGPAQMQANQAAAGIFNGATVGQELQNQQPVYQANLAAAQTQKQGTLEALQSTLNNIKAIQAGKGYAGDSFGNSLLNFQARQGANTQIANQVSQANIGNAQAVQGIKQNAINRTLGNLNLPFSMAQANINLAQAPANALAQQQGQRQQLFNMFNIGQGKFTYSQLPLVSPVASTGQNIGQGLGTLASGIGSNLASQQTAAQNQANTLQLINAMQWGNAGAQSAATSGNTQVALPNGIPISPDQAVTATDLSAGAVAASQAGSLGGTGGL